jgi:hypothetical protein
VQECVGEVEEVLPAGVEATGAEPVDERRRGRDAQADKRRPVEASGHAGATAADRPRTPMATSAARTIQNKAG